MKRREKPEEEAGKTIVPAAQINPSTIPVAIVQCPGCPCVDQSPADNSYCVASSVTTGALARSIQLLKPNHLISVANHNRLDHLPDCGQLSLSHPMHPMGEGRGEGRGEIPPKEFVLCAPEPQYVQVLDNQRPHLEVHGEG